MKTLILTDCETDGLDPATCQTIEVAVAFFDIATATVIESFSSLIHAETNAAEPINRIGVPALVKAPDALHAWTHINAMIDRAPRAAFVAHRAEFDRGFYPPRLAAALPWCCSKFDIEWPRSKVGASLVEVALAHDVPVHANHRALTDVMLLASVLRRVVEIGHDLSAIIARAMRPKALFEVADRSYSPERNAIAKSHGFHYDDKTPGVKRWVRSLAIADVSSLPFAVVQVSS